jgi:hypothetical protein
MGLGRTLRIISKPQLKRVLGLYELKQHKPWFDEECLQFLNQMQCSSYMIQTIAM